MHLPARCTLLTHCHLDLVRSIPQPKDNGSSRDSSILLLRILFARLSIQISSRYAGFLIVRPDLDFRWFENTLRLWLYRSSPMLLGLPLSLLHLPRSTVHRSEISFKQLLSLLSLLLLLFLILLESLLSLLCCSPRSSVLTPLLSLGFFLSLLSSSVLSSEQLDMILIVDGESRQQLE